MNLYCFIQCRSDSRRFPGKCFQEIGGVSIVERVYNICRTVIPNTVVIVPEDNTKLQKWLFSKYIPCFGGEKYDVLHRYYQAAQTYHATHIIRITADCVALDVAHLYYIAKQCLKTGVGFGSNAQPGRTSIDGNDVEFMTKKALNWACMKSTTDEEKEHVTKIFYERAAEFKADGFKIAHFNIGPNLAHIKTSIDTPEDLERVRGMII